MIMFRDIHRKFHPRGPALPLDQLILNDEITVHQLVGMLPDIIFVEFQFIVCAERTWRIAPLQHFITLFTDIVVDDVEIFFDRPVDE